MSKCNYWEEWITTDNQILILFFQFRDEFQVGAFHVPLDPLVDFAIEFWTEMIYPVASFTYNHKLAMAITTDNF